MVQNVREDTLKFQANALRYSDALLDAEVHIPVWQPSEGAKAAVASIYAQDRVTIVVIRG